MSESIRDGLHDAAEAVIDQAITIARETEKASAWSDHDRLVALGALDHLNANIIAGRVADAILAHLAAQATEAGVAEVIRRALDAGFEVFLADIASWNPGVSDHPPTTSNLRDRQAEAAAAALAPLLAARAETRTTQCGITKASHPPHKFMRDREAWTCPGIEVRDAD